ncbi:MAG: shikimate dehydrogenase [Candidatus Manganitrophaceae bacterium]|nr:MAG: shikimate dehydrogenase [Candidatus Manganitrophaceae bacterium]
MSDLKPITGQTKLFGIFGHPVAHTLSPFMHNAAFDAVGLPYRYVPFEVPPDRLEGAVKGILPLGIRGVNVTIPHKEAILPFLDQVDEEAKMIGAVNTVEVISGRLIGHNTDGRGFLESLFEMKVALSGKRVILLGAGGAARAVAAVLAQQSIAEMVIVARTAARGKALADRLAAISPGLKVSLWGADWGSPLPADPDRSTLLINTTPLGMKQEDPLPFPIHLIDSRWSVADLIYRPAETALLAAAKRAGAQVIPGLGMLLHQGVLAFEIWTGQKAPLSVMRQALQNALSFQDFRSR